MKQRVIQVSNVVVINKVNHTPVCASDSFGPSQFTLHRPAPERVALLREGYLKLFFGKLMKEILDRLINDENDH